MRTAPPRAAGTPAVALLLGAGLVWSSHPAAAQQNAVSGVLAAFDATCPAFLDDPEGFAAALPVPGPVGEDVTTTTADGAYTIVNTLRDGHVFTGEIVRLPGSGRASCTFSINAGADGAGELPLDESLAAFEAWRDGRDGRDALQVVGGRTGRKALTGMSAMPIAPEYPTHEYHVLGLVPGMDTLGSVLVMDGAFTIHAAADL
jgi:hypothetical protein